MTKKQLMKFKALIRIGDGDDCKDREAYVEGEKISISEALAKMVKELESGERVIFLEQVD